VGALIISAIGFLLVVNRGMHGKLWKIREELRQPVSDVASENVTSSDEEDFERHE
jgi:hypothetical protein